MPPLPPRPLAPQGKPHLKTVALEQESVLLGLQPAEAAETSRLKPGSSDSPLTCCHHMLLSSCPKQCGQHCVSLTQTLLTVLPGVSKGRRTNTHSGQSQGLGSQLDSLCRLSHTASPRVQAKFWSKCPQGLLSLHHTGLPGERCAEKMRESLMHPHEGCQ